MVYRGKVMFRTGIILRTCVNPQQNRFTNFKSYTGIKLLTPKKRWNKKLEGGGIIRPYSKGRKSSSVWELRTTQIHPKHPKHPKHRIYIT